MRYRGISRRNRQQFQEVCGSLVDLVRTIFVNGVMVLLAPFLVPISLAVQLWNSLPSFRRVKRAVPRSFGDVKRIPYSIWTSIPSAGELANMLLSLLQTLGEIVFNGTVRKNLHDLRANLSFKQQFPVFRGL